MSKLTRFVLFLLAFSILLPAQAPASYGDGVITLAQNDASVPEIELPKMPDLPVPPVPDLPDTSQSKGDTKPSSDESTPAAAPPPPPPSAATPATPATPPPPPSPVTQEAKPEADGMPELPKLPELPKADESKETTGSAATPPIPPLPNLTDIPPPEAPVGAEKQGEAEKEGTLNRVDLPPIPPMPEETPIDSTQEKKPASINLEECKDLPAKLAACESFSCGIEGFEPENPNFIQTWNVIRQDGDSCVYSESMPNEANLQCRLSESSRKAFSSYLETMLIKKSAVSDKTLNDDYFSARKKECQLFDLEGKPLDEKTYQLRTKLPEDIQDYGPSDAPRGDCETLDQKLKSCEPFYCKGNDPIQEKFFDRKIEVERKIIGWVNNSCMYVQKTGGKNLEGCKYVKTNGTGASECNESVLKEISKTGTLFNKLTIAEKAAMNEPTLNKPEQEETKSQGEVEEQKLALSERNYKTQTLPYIIHRKSYNEQNKTLPPAYYPSEFKIMAFTALDRNDLTGLKTFLLRVKEVDKQLKRQKKPLLGGIEIRDDRGNTPLIRSVMLGNFEAVRMLVGEGANLNAQNLSGVTALQAAAYIGRADMVTLLLGMGADRNIADRYGRTAMTHASNRNFLPIVQLLSAQ